MQTNPKPRLNRPIRVTSEAAKIEEGKQLITSEDIAREIGHHVLLFCAYEDFLFSSRFLMSNCYLLYEEIFPGGSINKPAKSKTKAVNLDFYIQKNIRMSRMSIVMVKLYGLMLNYYKWMEYNRDNKDLAANREDELCFEIGEIFMGLVGIQENIPILVGDIKDIAEYNRNSIELDLQEGLREEVFKHFNKVERELTGLILMIGRCMQGNPDEAEKHQGEPE